MPATARNKMIRNTAGIYFVFLFSNVLISIPFINLSIYRSHCIKNCQDSHHDSPDGIGYGQAMVQATFTIQIWFAFSPLPEELPHT